MFKRYLRIQLVLAMVIALTLIFGLLAYAEREGHEADFVPAEMLIKVKGGSDAGKAVAKMAPGAKILEKNGRLGFVRVKLPAGADVVKSISKFKNSSDVEYVEPNYIYKAYFTPNDPYYGRQWALPKIQADLAWDSAQGSSGVTVAVVDTGVDFNHPDLSMKLVSGYNAISNGTNAQDDNGHGTHVAGIVGAALNNGIGVAGNGGATGIMPVKVLNSSGSGYISDIAEGIIWAADHGAKVINMSFGSSLYSSTLAGAIDYANNKGVLLVAAAGNSGREKISYPAGNNHVIGVSATGNSDTLASFSSYGSHVDVSAPGVDILSTYWSAGSGSGYAYLNGTSMASPFVAGLAALVAGQNPDYSNGRLEQVIIASAADFGGAGWDKYYGYGRIDAYRAVQGAFDTEAPLVYNVSDNPDPFSPGKKTCTLSYAISEGSNVTLKITDSTGAVVRLMENNVRKAAGSYSVKWDGKNNEGVVVAAGIYAYTIDVIDGAGNAGSAGGTITVLNK